MNIDRAIHIIRNPYGFSEADQREARLLCATELEKFLPKARTAWQVIPYGEDRYGIFAGQEQIAMLRRPNEQETSWSKNTEANALRLIALAPRMLETLKKLAPYCQGHEFDAGIREARAILSEMEEP